MRSALLARTLARRGHEVVWWAGRFDHLRKRQRPDPAVFFDEGVEVRLIDSPGYSRNVSIRRVVDHRIAGRRLAGELERVPAPDLFVTCMPTIDLSWAAVRYAVTRGVPSIVDIRDLWPDFFLDHVPTFARPLARVALAPEFQRLNQLLRDASGLVGITPRYLTWGLEHANRNRRASDAVFGLGYECLRRADRVRAPVALFVGSFGQNYDLSTVIAAARVLASSHPALQFRFVGDGEMGARWRQEAAGLSNVTFCGWLSSDAIQGELDNATIGLVAYRAGAPQSLPNKVYEYMAGGLALVNSLTPDAAALVDQERVGINYRAGEPPSLVAALVSLLDSPDQCLAMGRRAHEIIATRYSTTAVYGAFADFVERLAMEARP